MGSNISLIYPINPNVLFDMGVPSYSGIHIKYTLIQIVTKYPLSRLINIDMRG
jgi:hypothetical protein